jgi:hypothetical protein
MALAAQQLQQGMHTMQLQCADEARRRTEEIQRLRAEGAAAAAAAAASSRALPMGATMRLPPAALYDGHTPPLEEWLSAMSQQYAWYGFDQRRRSHTSGRCAPRPRRARMVAAPARGRASGHLGPLRGWTASVLSAGDLC